eukprot:Rhum_TRINITY_DN2338_c0_g2::Rhum_TRINITY_DN2338_c0_g2_i1::g.6737::m.6737
MGGMTRLLCLSACVGALLAADNGVQLQATSKFAWVTIYYEAGKNDDEYALGARVLMQSIKATGTEADRVILIAEGTQEKYSKAFEQDGLKLAWVKNIESPWVKTLQRFAFSLNKLRIWSMTQYERVIFLDADVIAMQPADFLFQCGHFCAVFFNPINFHTAILIVKPEQAVYDDMIKKLNTLDSFDGADQGFINSYFTGFNGASEWKRGLPPSNDKMNRLPVPYNMHHIYYYEKMSWGAMWGSADNIVTMTYPITPAGKPWWWWCYPLMDMHFHWLKYRNQIDSFANYPTTLMTLFLAPGIHFLLNLYFKKQPRAGGPIVVVPDAEERPGLWFAWGRSSCKFVTIGMAFALTSMVIGRVVTPGITPPLLAWVNFLAYYTLSMYHLSQFAWKRASGAQLKLDNIHIVMFCVPWVLYFVAACYPYYPHGLIKLTGMIIALTVGLACNLSLFKMVHDVNAGAR